MPWSLHRFQESGDLHFITFSCYRRQQLLTPTARSMFEHALERSRIKYGFFIVGYVVMPEHVHLLISEVENNTLASAIQFMRQSVARTSTNRGVPRSRVPRSGPVLARPGVLSHIKPAPHPFWTQRYYDFNVWTRQKYIEKLRYMHRNPVTRGLVTKPEDWEWSSFRHYLSGVRASVEIESGWTARERERGGIRPQLRLRPTPPA